MNSANKYGNFLTRGSAAAALTLLLTSCTSTMQHTNVLVFGTNTKLAFDVSQDPTGAMGVTIGYKRQEAVWMPLLPNQGTAQGGLSPAVCTVDGCPKFEGIDKLGGPSDTYSVFASFGSKLGAGNDTASKEVRATGEIAQYFATGLAARNLSLQGSSLVNTAGSQQLSPSEKAKVDLQVIHMKTELNELMAALADPTNPTNVDKAKVIAAFAKSPGKDIANTRQEFIKKATTLAEAREAITAYEHSAVAQPMLQTLNAK